MTFHCSSRRFLPFLLTLPLLVAAPPLVCAVRAQEAATAPKTAVVSQISAQSATLAIGQKDGAIIGTIYALSQNGAEVLRAQIIQVRTDDSLCRVISLAPGATVLGETVRFVDVEALPPAPTVPAPSGPLDSTATNPTDTRTPEMLAPAPVASGGATVPITAINGAVVSVGAGSAQGLQAGQTLPVLRGADIVALVKLGIVEANRATGNLVYSESGTVLSTADVVTALTDINGSSARTGQPSARTGQPSARTGQPSAHTGQLSTGAVGSSTGVAVPFETGASNTSVPKADRTYELLASLAARGLIKSQPASTFQDDGARRHRYAEDIILSRAQIAGFIREALDNADEDERGRSSAGLAILTRDFRRDLQKLGVEDSRLDEAGASGKFSVGVSGFTRARAEGGVKANTLLPFEEQYGAGRLKSGVDSRLNVFGTVGSSLNFYGSVDTGTKLVQGGGSQSTFRKAYLSYDAGKFVRGLSFDIGRKEYYWGVGSFGTSLLGDAAGGLDGFSAKFERGSYRFESLYARLGRGPVGGQRSLYGQNLSVKIGNTTRVGVANTLLAPKSGFKAKDFFGAFTPVSLYLIDRPTLTAAESGTNAVVSAYAETGVARGVRTYGEIVLDDLATNAKNNIENRNGSTIGVQLFTPSDPKRAGLTLEYSRLNSISYLAYLQGVRDADYFYYQRGAPLGLPIAPRFPTNFGGAESLRADGYFRLMPKLTAFGSIQFADINSQDEASAVVGGRGFSRQQVGRFALAYDLRRNLVLTGRATYVSTDQPNFTVGEAPRKNTTFSLEIGHSF